MPRKTRPTPPSRPSTRGSAHPDAALLIEAALFMRVTATLLQALLAPTDALRRRLARTDAYRRVDGLNNAEDEPVWDAAGALEVNLARDITAMTDSLHQAARRAERAARRRHSGNHRSRQRQRRARASIVQRPAPS